MMTPCPCTTSTKVCETVESQVRQWEVRVSRHDEAMLATAGMTWKREVINEFQVGHFVATVANGEPGNGP